MIDICRVQESLRRQRIDGWLFADFHDRDSLGLKLLGLQAKKISTRRWYYWIPANGRPVKIAHAIESHRLEALEGDTLLYAGREKLVAALSFVLGTGHTIAMQYSPYCNLPTISMVDAGTAELVKSIGNVLVSSADLVQEFEASLTAEQIASHVRASQKVHHVLAEIVKGISKYLDQGSPQTERQVQLQILDSFEAEGLTCDGSLPIVAVNEHAADPHFEVSPGISSRSPFTRPLRKSSHQSSFIRWREFSATNTSQVADPARAPWRVAQGLQERDVGLGENAVALQQDHGIRGEVERRPEQRPPAIH